MAIKIGDMVRVRRAKDLKCEYATNGVDGIPKGANFVHEMFDACGKTFVVSAIRSRNGGIRKDIGEGYNIRLRIDNTLKCGWATFNEYMLEDENGKKVVIDEP